jgi:hypothetical protein
LASFILIFVYLSIKSLTSKYTNATNKLAQTSADSVELTKKKEKIDRSLDFLKNFDVKRFYKLRHLKFGNFPMKLLDICIEIDKMQLEPDFDAKNKRFKSLMNRSKNFIFLREFPNARFDINYFLNFFDIISIFYNKNNLDEDIFSSKISKLFTDFFLNFSDEIIQIIKSPVDFDDLYNNYDNYLIVIEKIAQKPDYSKIKKKLLDILECIREKE